MSDQSPPADVGRATGFRLAARDQTRINQTTADTQTTATNFEAVRQRNRAFAAARGHEGAVVFPKLGLFVITCLDPRTDPAHAQESFLREPRELIEFSAERFNREYLVERLAGIGIPATTG